MAEHKKGAELEVGHVLQEFISGDVTAAAVTTTLAVAIMATLLALFGIKKGAEKLYDAAVSKKADEKKESGVPKMPELPPLDVPKPESKPVKQQPWVADALDKKEPRQEQEQEEEKALRMG